jgi:predicted unusual protein kinase regulating ubiquinone biosynthesis (AarF/ABC1/UbiB family)
MLCVAQHVPVKVPSRKLKTWKFAGKFLWKNATVQNKSELGRWTKGELLELGPTFVKLGQIASTRGDLYPPEFTKELESLQDDVPPVEFDTIVDYDIFKEFDPVPFKSASIGQGPHGRTPKRSKSCCKIKTPRDPRIS